MLALSAHPLGIPISVLTPSLTDPAAQVCPNTVLGNLDDAKDLQRFFSQIDVLTFESEFVDTDLVHSHRPKGMPTFPALKTLKTIQDRLTQKELLEQFKIPTAAWAPVNQAADLKEARKQFSKGCVLKKRRFGYDGNGTFIFKGLRPPDTGFLASSPGGWIAEEWIPFQKEMATAFVRSSHGEFFALPLVESVQVDARCFSVCGPVKHPGFSHLTQSFRRLMTEANYVGILAVELFVTKNGLLVNELAPRVHNSAHYSQDALTCDQFEYHLRAGLGLPLPKVQLLQPGFAMVNLLGEGQHSPKLSWKPTGKLHWYGKLENRKGRKLGHLNVLGPSAKVALRQALRQRKEFKL